MVFLSAIWRDLLMANWIVDPALVEPFVPRGTAVDFHEGKTYVSVVGFLFQDTKLFGRLPIPFHRTFEEINLRLYVVRHHRDGDRRGVVFVKEIVPRRAIAWTANLVYNENYVALPTRHRIEHEPGAIRVGSLVRYAWRLRGKTHALRGRVAGEPALPPSGSEPEFITQHYWGYTKQRDGGTIEYEVEHPHWRVAPARDVRLQSDIAALYGPEFVETLRRPPDSAFIAEGSPVIVRRGVRIA
ncbi:MAG: hypothetical protein KatS3mg060_3545 [Dehalococcoidia bacterium]|jgi:uncharacterized protein YqjF (DUF2071 family)|nr:MAG: hypothetical protein KatS3mg060_3545 [Dehalococcoidia bacterium]